MKKYQYITITAVMILILSNSATAQFSIQATNNWYTGTSNVDRLNIGTGTTFPALLYLDGANTYSSNTGSVFETNAPSSTTTNWKMDQGGTESFRIENASGSSNVIMGTTGAGRLDLFTNGTGNTRVSVLGSGNTGYVGVGTTSPTSVLHIDGNNGTLNTGEVFRTNAATNAATYWRMYRDVSGTPTEIGRWWNGGGSSSYELNIDVT